MKKNLIVSFLALGLTTVIFSCGPKKQETKEVIIVPAPTQTIIREKEPVKKTTSITLDKNGVKVEGKKIDVNLKKN